MIDAIDISAEKVRQAYARRTRTVPPRRETHFDPGTLFIMQEREREVIRLLDRHGMVPLAGRDIVELGCGTGYWLRLLVQLGATPDRITGIDLLPSSIARARNTCAPGVRLEVGDGARLSSAWRRYDLVVQSTVLSSILDGAVRRALAAQLLRLCRPGGLILWYDARVRNPANPDLVGVSAREIRALFPGCAIELTSLTLAPPIARRLAPHSLFACQLLARLPPLRTHLLGAIRP